ncbi:N-acetyltransferase 9 [Chamberlinius hualienensis]
MLEGSKVHLVPYNVEHVVKYHEWMKSLELQELTASEPLSLEDEYEMQKSWREDNDKCTFIVLDAELHCKANNHIESMVGDVNLFLCDEEPFSAEVEIMIAEEAFRGRGLGTQAILLMMGYGVSNLSIKSFTAKIKLKNEQSIRLFEKLGFKKTEICQVFQEQTMKMDINSDEMTDLLNMYESKFIVKQI